MAKRRKRPVHRIPAITGDVSTPGPADSRQIPRAQWKSYREKLLDPRWQKRRLEILERDKWRCVSCCQSERTLHVHHTFYGKGIEPWDADDKHLMTLCEHCHEQFSRQHDELNLAVGEIDDIGSLKMATDIIAQFVRLSVGARVDIVDAITDLIQEHWLSENGHIMSPRLQVVIVPEFDPAGEHDGCGLDSDEA